MKDTFKPLAIATALSALVAGTVGVNAQTVGTYATLGDAVIVPYYTVQGDWVTGVHIINSSAKTQVVKFRMRSAAESADVLDFNLIMSPYDMWTGTITGGNDAMQVITTDKTCTAPEFENNGKTAPVKDAFLNGAQEGYIEIIAMAETIDESQKIALAAEHGDETVDGVTVRRPLDCDAVRTNFLVPSENSGDGLLGSGATNQTSKIAALKSELDGSSTYMDSGNVLKVSYFIRDNGSGTEFGNNAVHLVDFLELPAMTHQKYGHERFADKGIDALNGFSFPDLTGGGQNTGTQATRLRFNTRVRPALGAINVLNDWSYNEALGASTDWVITFPGQYLMTDPYAKAKQVGISPPPWDFREMPFEAKFSVWDREENAGTPGGLKFSPSPAADTAVLPKEVNVVTWGPDTTPAVLKSVNAIRSNPEDAGITAAFGWAALSVTGTVKFQQTIQGPVPVDWQFCDLAGGPVAPGGVARCTIVSGMPPMVGFAAWNRTFDDPDKNYGRLVEHSFTK